MENLVYFPTFEPLSQEWLKFAILYVENFDPIIPYSGNSQLSYDYLKVIDEADLIKPYQPKYDQGDRASTKVVEFFDKVVDKPDRYVNIFNRANILRDIRNPRVRFKIYSEKFSFTFEDFCLKNELGIKTDGGILVAEELAFIYLAFLAEEIAYDEGKSIITDNNQFDNFLSFNRMNPYSIRGRENFARGVLSLLVPKNINEISIDNLITFRKVHRKKIAAFNHELNHAFDQLQNGITEEDFVDRFKDIYSELTNEILAQGIGIASIPLGTCLLLNKPDTGGLEYVTQIAGGIGLIMVGGLAIGRRWKEIVAKHNCRRYLTQLQQLR